MVNFFFSNIKRNSKKFIFCLDTSFIEGTILKLIQKGNWNIDIKEDKRLNELNSKSCLLLINDINIYEIKNKLLREFNLPLSKIDEVYRNSILKFNNIKYVSIGDIKINHPFVNWLLKHKLSLEDGLLINIAQRLELPFVTSERKAKIWKDAYKGVMSQEEFWDELRKI